jgi:starvation-inducible DNA-binding protein
MGPTNSRSTHDRTTDDTRFHVPFGSDERAVAGELQGMLVDLIDLALIGKQAHWNVEGRWFRSLHLDLDELVDDWRTLGDEVAERAVAIGAAPDGRAETVAGSTEIEPLPTGALGDHAIVEAMASRPADVTARTRRRIDPPPASTPSRRIRSPSRGFAREAALDDPGAARPRLTHHPQRQAQRSRGTP